MDQDNQPDDLRFMNAALGLAREAEASGEVPVGAIVVLDGQVIGRGFNSPIGSNDVTGHAEIRAIRDASIAQGNYRLTGCTLYVTLEPCVMCAGAMVHARVARLVFGCRDPKAGAAGSLYDVVRDPRLNHRIEVTAGVADPTCRDLLLQFFAKRRRNSSAPPE